jgi:hypothetical protein
MGGLAIRKAVIEVKRELLRLKLAKKDVCRGCMGLV